MRAMIPDRDIRVRRLSIPTAQGGIPALLLTPKSEAPKGAAGVGCTAAATPRA